MPLLQLAHASVKNRAGNTPQSLMDGTTWIVHLKCLSRSSLACACRSASRASHRAFAREASDALRSSCVSLEFSSSQRRPSSSLYSFCASISRRLSSVAVRAAFSLANSLSTVFLAILRSLWTSQFAAMPILTYRNGVTAFHRTGLG